MRGEVSIDFLVISRKSLSNLDILEFYLCRTVLVPYKVGLTRFHFSALIYYFNYKNVYCSFLSFIWYKQDEIKVIMARCIIGVTVITGEE